MLPSGIYTMSMDKDVPLYDSYGYYRLRILKRNWMRVDREHADLSMYTNIYCFCHTQLFSLERHNCSLLQLISEFKSKEKITLSLVLGSLNQEATTFFLGYTGMRSGGTESCLYISEGKFPTVSLWGKNQVRYRNPHSSCYIFSWM